MGGSTKVHLLTCDFYPLMDYSYRIWFGASVSARSVKIINDKSPERDVWWNELREEIKKNALSLECNFVLGYRETMNVHEDTMILNVTGTAVKVRNQSSFILRQLNIDAVNEIYHPIKPGKTKEI